MITRNIIFTTRTERTRRFLVSLCLCGLFSFLQLSPVPNPAAGSIALINGVVYTVDDRNTVAEAILIRAGRIVKTGRSAEIRSLAGSMPVIDLQGKAVVPGLIDAHGHMLGLGRVLQDVNLVGTTSYEQVVARVKERAARTPRGEWIIGRGWDQNDWASKTFPNHRDLSAAVPDHPVYLTRVDGHAGLVNSRAMLSAGLNSIDADPPGGKVIRDQAGNPTGVLIDNAQNLVRKIIPPASPALVETQLLAAIRECSRFGLTGVHDAGVDGAALAGYKRALDSGKMSVRVYVMLSPGAALQQQFRQGPETADGFLKVRSIKLVADGALGSLGAALLAPYSDDPGNSGLILRRPEEMRAIINEALQKGFQVCTHAIGDRANRLVLDMYEAGLKAHPRADHRYRVEHAQVIAASDLSRFKKLGVIPSMQQTHCTSDMYWAQDRVGPERIKGAYAWRKLIQDGNIIAGGSDFPVESANPLLGFYAAITRQDAKAWPPGGWQPDQRMTREEALKSFTRWAAYAAFEEKEKGSLEAGKLGDLIVLSRDIMKIEPRMILGTEVLTTILDGRVVWQKP